MPQSFLKDPQATLDYQVDWSGWLTGGDTISSATVTASTGLTVDRTDVATETVTAWVSGGSVGCRYTLVFHIVTAGGRTDERTLTILAVQR